MLGAQQRIVCGKQKNEKHGNETQLKTGIEQRFRREHQYHQCRCQERIKSQRFPSENECGKRKANHYGGSHHRRRQSGEAVVQHHNYQREHEAALLHAIEI